MGGDLGGFRVRLVFIYFSMVVWMSCGCITVIVNDGLRRSLRLSVGEPLFPTFWFSSGFCWLDCHWLGIIESSSSLNLFNLSIFGDKHGNMSFCCRPMTNR